MTFYTDIKAILEDGTWSSLGYTPDFYEWDIHKKKYHREGIMITKMEHPTITLLNGQKLVEYQRGKIYGWVEYSSTSQTTRDNMEEDCVRILEDSVDSLIFDAIERKDTRDVSSFRLIIKRVK